MTLRRDDAALSPVVAIGALIAVALVVIVAVVVVALPLSVGPSGGRSCAAAFTVTTTAGTPVSNAAVSVAGATGRTSPTGQYTMRGLSCGPTTAAVTEDGSGLPLFVSQSRPVILMPGVVNQITFSVATK